MSIIRNPKGIVKPHRAVSHLIDQCVQREETHVAAAAWHWDRAERARRIRSALEDLAFTAVGTAAAWGVADG